MIQRTGSAPAPASQPVQQMQQMQVQQVQQMQHPFAQQQQPPQQAAARPQVPQAPRVRAIYPYTAQTSEELTIVQGAEIELIQKDDEHWWYGMCNGTKGFFPANYVQPI